VTMGSENLKLDGIALRHFKNDVGILSFHLINDRYDNFDDILNINDFGRRLFPQFLGDGLVEATKNLWERCGLPRLVLIKLWQENFYLEVKGFAILTGLISRL